MKKVISVLLLLLLLCPTQAFLANGASAEAIESLAVNPYGGGADDIDAVKWFSAGEERFLFLPSDAAPETALVYFTAAGDVTLDGAPISSGQSASGFTVGRHTLVCGDCRYALTVCRSAELPAVFLSTESGSLDFLHADKENREPGRIRIYENGEMTLESPLAQIKGRGNATWEAPKKPYNIKFKSKTDLLGMGKAKKWTLLANYLDETLLRNVYAWEYAKAFGLYYSSDYRHVDLYINGEYLGNYIICESVEVGQERVAIRDLEKENEAANPGVSLDTLPRIGTGANGAVLPGTAGGSAKWIDMPASPEDFTGGYLLELELAYRYDDEPCGFVTDSGQAVVIKSPELASEAEVRYIRTVVNDAFNALYSPSGFNEKGQHYTDCFDMDAFVNMYILQELSANIDAGVTSTFLFQSPESGRLVFSPVWDFDHAFGDEVHQFEVNSGDPGIWWANSIAFPHELVFTAAFRHEDFRDAVNRRWAQLTAANAVRSVRSDVRDLSDTLRASAVMNLTRWNASARDFPDAAAQLYRELTEKGERYLEEREKTLSKGFSDDAAMLYYDANGGSGNVYNPYVAVQGASVPVIAPIRRETGVYPPEDRYRFAGWNTAADGKGETYQPGDTIRLDGRSVVLYAVWEPLTEPDGEPGDAQDGGRTSGMSFWQRLAAFFQRIAAFFRSLFRRA